MRARPSHGPRTAKTEGRVPPLGSVSESESECEPNRSPSLAGPEEAGFVALRVSGLLGSVWVAAAFEDRIVRRRDIVSEYGLRRPRAQLERARVAASISMWAMSSTALLASDVADGGSLDDGVPRSAFLAV